MHTTHSTQHDPPSPYLQKVCAHALLAPRSCALFLAPSARKRNRRRPAFARAAAFRQTGRQPFPPPPTHTRRVVKRPRAMVNETLSAAARASFFLRSPPPLVRCRTTPNTTRKLGCGTGFASAFPPPGPPCLAALYAPPDPLFFFLFPPPPRFLRFGAFASRARFASCLGAGPRPAWRCAFPSSPPLRILYNITFCLLFLCPLSLAARARSTARTAALFPSAPRVSVNREMLRIGWIGAACRVVDSHAFCFQVDYCQRYTHLTAI